MFRDFNSQLMAIIGYTKMKRECFQADISNDNWTTVIIDRLHGQSYTHELWYDIKLIFLS